MLVPGAGLGRLVHDIAQLGMCAKDSPPAMACALTTGRPRSHRVVRPPGFQGEGNEVSYFMLLASDLIMNRCVCPHARMRK